MPSRTILLKKTNKDSMQRAALWRSSFCVEKGGKGNKGILIHKNKETSLFHRLIHNLFITLK